MRVAPTSSDRLVHGVNVTDEDRSIGNAAERGPDSCGVSATSADWSREDFTGKWEPQRHLLRSIRSHASWSGRRGPIATLVRWYNVARWRFWSAVTSCDIPLGTEIAGGLVLPHATGIVIHGRSKIGPNCMVFQNVTIGYGGKEPGVPTLGGHVDVGAGAVILGGVTIGDHARIGANAVVLCDVPPGRTAVGVPAKVI